MTFYYQEMASAKDKVTETTIETEVKEVGGKVDKCYGDRLYANILGSLGFRGRCQGKVMNKIKKETCQNKIIVNK